LVIGVVTGAEIISAGRLFIAVKIYNPIMLALSPLALK
jgi:hypothetical protein